MEKKQCSAYKKGTGYHSYRCTRNATCERHGKPYCSQHDPDRVVAKNTKRWAEQTAAIEARVAAQKFAANLREAELAVLAAARDWRYANRVAESSAGHALAAAVDVLDEIKESK